MEIISSGTIKNIEEFENRYKFIFSLYYNNGIPCTSIGRTHKDIIILFEKIKYVYQLKEIGCDIDAGFLEDTELIMVNNLSYYELELYLIVSKTNQIVIKGMENKKFDFEIVIHDDHQLLILTIIDNKLKRLDKLKKIKEKINVR